MAELREVNVVVFGLGQVGRALLSQIVATRSTIAARTNLYLRVVALADSHGLLVAPQGLGDEAIREVIQGKAQGRPLAEYPGARTKEENQEVIEAVSAFNGRLTIMVDVTAAEGMESVLRQALEQGWGAVLANKRPLAGPWPQARPFFETRCLRCEAAVGAGLPVIATLRTLLDSGDRVTAIEGVLSGTVGYIFSQLQLEVPFSTALRQAQELGYTEPDPREDLGGVDVARKLLVLGRIAGWPLELDDLEVEPLYPSALADCPVETFMEAIAQEDERFAQRVEAAHKEGRTLRYIAEVDERGGRVGLRAVPQASPLGTLQGPENLVSFFTSRYAVSPLTIVGKGAGGEVTAAGVLSDIISLALEMEGCR